MDNSELINLLEEEMIRDVASIDLSADEEDAITEENIKAWYFEAEKVIRVLANVLSVPMNQAINQLRYAGHHILKARADENIRKQNLIEAFKHCKRSLYDALDFYVYKLNSDFRTLMPYLDSQSAIKLENLLLEHIKRIQVARTESGIRIDYYKGIQDGLIDGLKLIERLNEIQRETGTAKALLSQKRALIDKNGRLEDRLDILQTKNKELEGKINSRFNFFSILIAVALTLGIVMGLIVADAFITRKHEITMFPEAVSETSINSPSPTPLSPEAAGNSRR